MSNDITLTVPGVVYHECLDPLATDTPAQNGWPKPAVVKRGYGKQYVYDVDSITAYAIIKYVSDWADGLSYGVDSDMARTARVMRRWALNALETHE